MRCSRTQSVLLLVTLFIIALASRASAEELRLLQASRVLQLVDAEQEKPAVVTAVSLLPGGGQLAAAGDDHIIRVWDPRTGELLNRRTGHRDWVRAVAYSPDGAHLASTGNDCRVRIWSAETGALEYALPKHNQAVSAIVYSPDGSLLITAGFEKNLHVYDPREGKLMRTLPCLCADNRALTVSSRGKFVAVAGRDGQIRVWNLADSSILRDIKAHTRRVRAIAFSPDEQTLASAGEGQYIRFWDMATGLEKGKLVCRPAKVFAMTYVSIDRLVTGGSDNVVNLWNLPRGQIAFRLEGHTGSIASLAYDRQSGLLASGSYDTTIRIWDLRRWERDETALRDAGNRATQ